MDGNFKKIKSTPLKMKDEGLFLKKYHRKIELFLKCFVYKKEYDINPENSGRLTGAGLPVGE